MLKSALGIIISLCAFIIVAAPAAQAAGTSASKATSKKQTIKKSTGKRKASGMRHSSAKVSLDRHPKLARKAVVRSQNRSAYQRVAYTPAISAVPSIPTVGGIAGLNTTRDPLALKSNAAVVIDQASSQVLFEKNANVALPIASLTKLMTALIVVESRQNLDELLDVTADDIDREKNSRSRLRVGAQMTRTNMLHIALMSSENRAASALGRNYPGGLPAFVAAMNAKAKALGMNDTHYVDSTGLSSHNVASARDLSKLVVAAYQHTLIREYSTDAKYAVDTGRNQLQYMNSNRLVMNPGWEIGLQKTGYITEAGRCLVMQTRVDGRPVVMVFLDSKGKESRLADAGRIRKWLEISRPQVLTQTVARQS
jgi:serine-type D-Ala-D-Ala endopeptidase (penicillin-binding protein 7)